MAGAGSEVTRPGTQRERLGYGRAEILSIQRGSQEITRGKIWKKIRENKEAEVDHMRWLLSS